MMFRRVKRKVFCYLNKTVPVRIVTKCTLIHAIYPLFFRLFMNWCYHYNFLLSLSRRKNATKIFFDSVNTDEFTFHEMLRGLLLINSKKSKLIG